jgi:hypothetical protein
MVVHSNFNDLKFHIIDYRADRMTSTQLVVFIVEGVIPLLGDVIPSGPFRARGLMAAPIIRKETLKLSRSTGRQNCRRAVLPQIVEGLRRGYL